MWQKACSDFADSGPLTETLLVGAMADWFAGEWLHWDHHAVKLVNYAGATALVRRAYRDEWKISGLG